MTSRERREIRGYVGSGIVFLFVILLLLFLSQFEVPESNNDAFKLIVGALVSVLAGRVVVALCLLANMTSKLLIYRKKTTH